MEVVTVPTVGPAVELEGPVGKRMFVVSLPVNYKLEALMTQMAIEFRHQLHY